MRNKEAPALQEVDWQDVRDNVTEVNKELASIIDKLSPDKRFKLIKARYNYGDIIVKDGVTYLPTSKFSLSPITDLSCEPKLKSKLAYSPIPLFLTLKSAHEVFIDTGSRIIPLNFFYPGNILGLFESMDYIYGRPIVPVWSVSAGARSIFTLPKITEASGFKRLRMEFGLPSVAHLKHLSDHWNIFKFIANHQNFNQPWQSEILFFTEEWLMNQYTDPEWLAFQRFLFKSAWHQAQFAIGKIELSLNWEAFIDAISLRNLKPTPYLSDQIKHIMLIASGKWPGFRPADCSQLIAPIKGLQQAITDVYLLKQYIPTIMHIYPTGVNNNVPVYYSLFYPTLLEGSPQNRSASTIMLDLRDIKLLLEMLRQTFKGNLKFQDETIVNTRFDFFHVEPDKYSEIHSSKLIPASDPAFLVEKQIHKERDFCFTSPFWRGCVKVLTMTS